MASKAFGELLKALRLRTGCTMREFCLRHGFDPGNFSRLERGVFEPPQRAELLERYAAALGLEKGTDEWLNFFDTAAASRGEIPPDLLSDEEVLRKLPLLFRTLRKSPSGANPIDELIEKVRRA